ncbi:Peptidyl-prolyl cis-trans isomerase PpiD [Minicystis rosea]|nr:Peptidyl-prolyl cis-trans isomerase PpiD [Minicystis rosea]
MLNWSPRAVALTLVSLSVLGCDQNKGSQPAGTTSTSVTSAPPSATTTASAAPTTQPSGEAPAGSATPVAPDREIAGASQILVSYKGAELADKTVTRSKEEAKRRAEEALRKIKKDKMPFEEAAKKYSDDANSKNIGGAIGNFEKNAMPGPFSTATFALKVGEISDVVETPRGFHIIKRTH